MMKDIIATNIVGTDFITVLLLWSMVFNAILIGIVILLMFRLSAQADTHEDKSDGGNEDNAA